MEGMLRSKSESIVSDKLLLNLWEHELSRVVPDRFISNEDSDWFKKNIVDRKSVV